MLIPDEKIPGGLETLCVEVLKEKAPHVLECAKAYFSCGKIEVNQWNKEKQAKAWYGAMVAAFYEDEPTKVVASAFMRNDREKEGDLPPLIPVTHKCFDSVEKRIRDFCDTVLKDNPSSVS